MKVICDYCGKPAQYVDSAILYPGRSYGMCYYCPDCAAWVGVHKGTDRPKGRLANAELREYKQRAHAAFDQLWKRRYMRRNEAYRWLSAQMELTEDETHIGMFDVPNCRKAITICNNKMEEFNHGRTRRKH